MTLLKLLYRDAVRTRKNLTFHKAATKSASKSNPPIMLPTITPIGTSPLAPGLLTVMSAWDRETEPQVISVLNPTETNSTSLLASSLFPVLAPHLFKCKLADVVLIINLFYTALVV